MDKPDDPAHGGDPLVAVEQRTVRLDDVGDEVVAIRAVDGEIYVPLAPLCRTLGLDVQGQTQRIRRHDALTENLVRVAVPTSGGTQPTLCLQLEGLPLWLAGIETGRVRPELRPSLKTFQLWARRRIYEAFVAETGIEALPGDPTIATAMTPREGASALDEIEAFGLSLAAFARKQRAFEQRHAADLAVATARLDDLDTRVAHIDHRVDHAAEAFGVLLREVNIRLDGSDVITDAQQSDIKALVQAIGQEMQRRSAPNPYQSIWTSLYKQFRVPTYSRIKISQYPAVMAWLEDQLVSGDDR